MNFFLCANSDHTCIVHVLCLPFSPVREVVLVPLVPGEGVAFPPHIGFDLAAKLVRNTTARPLHGTAGVESQKVRSGRGV